MKVSLMIAGLMIGPFIHAQSAPVASAPAPANAPAKLLPGDKHYQVMIERVYQEDWFVISNQQIDHSSAPMAGSLEITPCCAFKIKQFPSIQQNHKLYSKMDRIKYLFLIHGKRPVSWEPGEAISDASVRLDPVDVQGMIKVWIAPQPYSSDEEKLKRLEELECKLLAGGCGYSRANFNGSAVQKLVHDYFLPELDSIPLVATAPPDFSKRISQLKEKLSKRA